MSYASYTYTGDGSTTTFAIPFPFINSADISVTVNGTAASFTFPTSNQVLISPAPASNAAIKIIRTTQLASPLVSYSDGSVFGSADLNVSAEQATYTAQELSDRLDALTLTSLNSLAGAWNAGNVRIVNVADPLSGTDAATKEYVDSAIGQYVLTPNPPFNPLSLSIPLTILDAPLHVGGLTFGAGNNACLLSVCSNVLNPSDNYLPTADRAAQVMGGGQGSDGNTFTDDIQSYGDRDSVTFYAENTAPPLISQSDAVSTHYTPTSVTSGSWTNRLSLVKPGMWIDTNHSPKWTGYVTGVSGNTINVKAWWQTGNNTPLALIPPGSDGYAAFVNPVTKVWSFAGECNIPSMAYGSAATAFEMDANVQKADSTWWGFDCVNTGMDPTTKALKAGYYSPTVSFISRGRFFVGFQANSSDYASFSSWSDPGWSQPQYGFVSANPTVSHFYSYTPSGQAMPTYSVLCQDNSGTPKTTFSVDNAGNIVGTTLAITKTNTGSGAGPAVVFTSAAGTNNLRLDPTSGFHIDNALTFDGSSAPTMPSAELRANAGQPFIDFTNDLTTDYNVRLQLTDTTTLTVQGGNLKMLGGGWNSEHLIMGGVHLWVDSTGALRRKTGAPTGDTDGSVVG